MADPRQSHYQLAWHDAVVMPAPSSPASLYGAPPTNYSDAVDNPFTLHFPASPSHSSAFANTFDQLSYAHSIDSLHHSMRSPSPFSSDASSPFELGERFDASADSTDSVDVDGSSSSSSAYSPSPPPPSSDSSPITPPAAPASAAAASGAAPVKRKRERIRGLTREQRAERKRNKHRAIDAQRRHKEIAALATLRGIVQQQQQQTTISGAWEEDEAGEAEEGVQSKAVVLESSIAMIRQLQQLCARMQAACNAKDEQLVSVTSHLERVIEARSDELVPSLQSASRHIEQLQRSSCLRQSGLFSSVLCIAALAMPLSLIVDCNQAFVDCAGWSKAQLIHSTMRPPPTFQVKAERDIRASYPVCPLVVLSGGDGDGRRATKRQQLRLFDGSTADCGGERYVQQYPSSMRDIVSLVNGAAQKVTTTWRLTAADGALYEVQTTFWREEYPVEERNRQPLRQWRMMTAHSMYDRVRVDDDEHDDGTLMQ